MGDGALPLLRQKYSKLGPFLTWTVYNIKVIIPKRSMRLDFFPLFTYILSQINGKCL